MNGPEKYDCQVALKVLLRQVPRFVYFSSDMSIVPEGIQSRQRVGSLIGVVV